MTGDQLLKTGVIVGELARELKLVLTGEATNVCGKRVDSSVRSLIQVLEFAPKELEAAGVQSPAEAVETLSAWIYTSGFRPDLDQEGAMHLHSDLEIYFGELVRWNFGDSDVLRALELARGRMNIGA